MVPGKIMKGQVGRMGQQMGKGLQGKDERHGENWGLHQHGARRAPGYAILLDRLKEYKPAKENMVGCLKFKLDSKTRTRWISTSLTRAIGVG